VLVLLAGGLTGGAPSDLSGTPATSAGSPARSDAETIGAAGSYDVLVQRVDPARGTMTVDAVQYFTGLAAARACAEDGVPDQRGTLCHEFYIRDRSSRLWTVPLSADADIAVRAGGCGPARSIAIDDLAAGLTRHRLFRLDISDGVGIRLTEPCGP
jgi:hypothetical protein